MSHRDDEQVGGDAQAFDAHGPSHDERTTTPAPPAEQTVYRAAGDRARTNAQSEDATQLAGVE